MTKDEQLEDIYRNSTGIDTIMFDLGSEGFIKMTGCHDFFTDSSKQGPWLRMDIPQNKGNVNRLEITLQPDDTYRMEFYLLRYSKVKFEKEKCNACLYTDLRGTQIRDVFTAVTGLDIIMPKIVSSKILNNISDYLESERSISNIEIDNKLKL